MVVYKISLPAGPGLKTNRFVKDCETQLQNHKMFVDLVVVEMSGFDVILGMDWLLRHEAQINCKDKSVTLVDHDGKAFLFQAQQLPQIAVPSVLAAAHVKLNEQQPKLEDILVVREYPDVFPANVFGLPPVRKVEFSIVIKVGSLPISKAP
ncbi:uncharacterized protein LOC124931518 [Impatiens glandulifera]|uniref:uncharacterized protein LOC124931518 n=1 Tax=Impatiens glandulifera TaxID=253017 RepID=UPI001FB0B601|nr:uncharacterized protein LOC124931518 [Impatiens glandulifera]